MEWLTVSKTFDKSKKHLKYTNYSRKIHESCLLTVELYALLNSHIDKRIVLNINFSLGHIGEWTIIHYFFKYFGKARKDKNRSVIS